MTANFIIQGLGLQNNSIEINYISSEVLDQNMFQSNPISDLEYSKALAKSDPSLSEFRNKYKISANIIDNDFYYS